MEIRKLNKQDIMATLVSLIVADEKCRLFMYNTEKIEKKYNNNIMRHFQREIQNLITDCCSMEDKAYLVLKDGQAYIQENYKDKICEEEYDALFIFFYKDEVEEYIEEKNGIEKTDAYSFKKISLKKECIRENKFSIKKEVLEKLYPIFNICVNGHIIGIDEPIFSEMNQLFNSKAVRGETETMDIEEGDFIFVEESEPDSH